MCISILPLYVVHPVVARRRNACLKLLFVLRFEQGSFALTHELFGGNSSDSGETELLSGTGGTLTSHEPGTKICTSKAQ